MILHRGAGRHREQRGLAGADLADHRQVHRATPRWRRPRRRGTTAYPSIAELSKPGRSTSARARPRPPAGRGPPSAAGRRPGSGVDRGEDPLAVLVDGQPVGGMRVSHAPRRVPGATRLGRGASPSGDLADDLHARGRRSSRRRPSSDVGLAQRRRAVGEALVELADQLVVRRVEVDERQRRRRPGRARSPRRRRRRRSAAPAGRWWSSPARTGRGRPRSAAAPSKTSIAAPIAVSIWITSGVDGSAGSTVLTLRISGRPRMPSRRVELLASSPRRSNQRLLVEQNRCRSRSASASLSSGERLRGLAQHDPAVGLAAGEVAALAVRRRYGGRPRSRTAHPDAANQPATRGVGDRAEVVGVGDEDPLVARRRSAGLEQAGAAQRGVEVAVAGRAPLEVGVARPADRRQVVGAAAWAPCSAGTPAAARRPARSA